MGARPSLIPHPAKSLPWYPNQILGPPRRASPFYGMRRGSRPCPPAAFADGATGKGTCVVRVRPAFGPRQCPSPIAVPCTVRFGGPNYKNWGVLAPDVGGASLSGRSFVSFPFWVAIVGLGGGGPRFQAGARVLDRTGTDKGWYSRHSQTQGRRLSTAALGSSFGAGPRQVCRANGRTGAICRKGGAQRAARLATGK